MYLYGFVYVFVGICICVCMDLYMYLCEFVHVCFLRFVLVFWIWLVVIATTSVFLQFKCFFCKKNVWHWLFVVLFLSQEHARSFDVGWFSWQNMRVPLILVCLYFKSIHVWLWLVFMAKHACSFDSGLFILRKHTLSFDVGWFPLQEPTFSFDFWVAVITKNTRVPLVFGQWVSGISGGQKWG